MITAVEILNEKQESIPENKEFDDNEQIEADDILREVHMQILAPNIQECLNLDLSEWSPIKNLVDVLKQTFFVTQRVQTEQLYMEILYKLWLELRR
ncbi:hypothetical protein FF38_13861 [Lucilia cuprina]|uniref:Uncharacterized protein n=1 Tax=Lucilia cuprina TaxID=7375 RepID=A0A0L0CQN3_LUCCU|nr:hypothetical protein FF38_13861 [Lucilia cuprina]